MSSREQMYTLGVLQSSKEKVNIELKIENREHIISWANEDYNVIEIRSYPSWMGREFYIFYQNKFKDKLMKIQAYVNVEKDICGNKVTNYCHKNYISLTHRTPDFSYSIGFNSTRRFLIVCTEN